MTRTTARTAVRPDPRRQRRRSGRRTLAALVALALVTTAAAPATIRIQRGDTLWELARKHGTSVDALKRLNDLPGNGTIYAGDTLRLPGGSTGADSSGGSSGSGSGSGSGGDHVHTVSRGDTLSQLAVRYGVPQRTIAERNGLSGSLIRVGQRLAVPGSSGAVSAGTGAPVPSGTASTVAGSRAALAARSQPSKAQAQAMVRQTAARHGVDPSLAQAVAFHESGFQMRVVSPVNAIGVMQVMPLTGRNLSRQIGRELDLYDAQDNITAGVLVLRQLLRITGGDLDRALAGYYQGLGSIARQGVLPQTRQYIRIIHIHRARF
jgi:N-acetylmuramoyl-L-alanine amidase